MYLSGSYDLGIFGWFPPDQLGPFLATMRDRLENPKYVVLPIERISTPFQRSEDVPGVRPTRFERHFKKVGQRWETPDGSRNDLPSYGNLMKFYMVIRTRFTESNVVFSKLIERFEADASSNRPHFQHHTVCTYRTDSEEGCIVSAYTEPGFRLRNKVFDILKLDEEVHSRTYFCLDVLSENDHPWLSSIETAKVPNLGPLGSRAVRALTGTDALRSQDTRNVVPEIEQLIIGEQARKGLLSYDPYYWWDFTSDVRWLITQIVRGHEQPFLNLLMKRYIQVELSLKNSIRRLFQFRGKQRDDDQDEVLEWAILNHLKIQKFDECDSNLINAMQRVQTWNGVPQSELQQLLTELGSVQRYLKSIGRVEGRITLGVVPKVINQIINNNIIPKKLAFGRFAEDDFMNNWDKNLTTASRDRNEMVHGEIVQAFKGKTDPQGFGPWRRLLNNYLIVYPQTNLLIRELNRIHEEGSSRLPIKITRPKGF
jgi:hypothetical protein